jgi:small subunit ribosomal protein S17
MSTSTEEARGSRRSLSGEVVSNRMDKTIVVRVERRVKHPLYKKEIRRFSKYYVHDENNEAKVGDSVNIAEVRPLSKLKRWRLVKVLNTAGV